MASLQLQEPWRQTSVKSGDGVVEHAPSAGRKVVSSWDELKLTKLNGSGWSHASVSEIRTLSANDRIHCKDSRKRMNVLQQERYGAARLIWEII